VRAKKIIVLHLAGQYPLAGIAWQAIHYILGLKRLGYEVYYIEDSGSPPYDPRIQCVVEDSAYCKMLGFNIIPTMKRSVPAVSCSAFSAWAGKSRWC
jgi:hypothetical protein